jgi:hypothetical protein
MSTESVNFASSRVSTRAVVATFGGFVSALFWLVVATYPTFFLFNPFAETDSVRATFLTATTVGWVLISTGPVVLFTTYALGVAKALRFLPVVALVWPVTLLLNHISLFIEKGQWYTGYLVDYPIFIATDILLPVLLIAVWAELRPAYTRLHRH